MSMGSPHQQPDTAAEEETIRRLRREVLGLTLTVDALKRNSKEREFLSSKLNVAREELDAVLEDEQLFRSISSSAGSNNLVLTTRSISEERCEELLDMIPTPPLTVIPTPPLVASNAVQELKDKLSQQVKYSLEWFEIKKQIEISKVTVNPNINFSRSSTTGSIVSPRRRKKPNRLPSMGSSNSERLRPTVMTSMKDGQNMQCLKEQLDRATKYSLEWFDLKRRISRSSSSMSEDPKVRTVQRRRKSSDAEVMKENSSPEKVDGDQSQHSTLEQQDSPSKTQSSYNISSHCKNANLEPPDGRDDHAIPSLSMSDSSSAPDLSLQSEPQKKAHNLSDIDLPSVTDHTSRTSKE